MTQDASILAALIRARLSERGAAHDGELDAAVAEASRLAHDVALHRGLLAPSAAPDSLQRAINDVKADDR